MKTLIKAAVRIVIAFMLYGALMQLIVSIMNILLYKQYGDSGILIYTASVSVVWVATIVILLFAWIKADRLVRLFAGPIRGNEITINTSNSDLLAAAVSIFGVYLVVSAVTGLAGLYAYHWIREVLTPPEVINAGWTASEISSAIVHTLSLLIGAGLLWATAD